MPASLPSIRTALQGKLADIDQRVADLQSLRPQLANELMRPGTVRPLEDEDEAAALSAAP